ncbi:serine/threonine-protein kinase D6PKL1-like protein [Tanacetum coccineum]
MSSRYGTCEIVELEHEPESSDRANDKGKNPQGSNPIVDDINKLFEAINVRTSYHGLTPLSGGTTPRRNPSKKPMRMSTSSSYSGNGYSEPVSLKQALRGLCISQASEMAALKRLSKPPGSPALSELGKIANSYKSDKASDSTTFVGQVKKVKVLIPEESTSMATSSRAMPDYLQGGPKMKSSDSNSPQSSVQFNKKEKSPKRVKTGIWQNEFLCEPESRNVLPMIESALHAKKCVAYDEPSKPVVNGSKAKPTKSVNKASFKLRQKGSLQSTPSSSFISSSKLGKSIKLVKTVIRNKNIVKKKSKQDLPSATSVIENVTFVPDTCQLAVGSNSSVIYNNTNFKYGDKSDFTQTSNSSSMCEYSSSTSISEESSRCSIGNRPHMSMESRRQAIHDMMKWNSRFLGLRHFNLLNKLGCGDTGTVYLAELVGTNLRYAIKVMDNEFLERRKKMARAHTEREILRILDHPFLPTLYAYFVSANLSCLVMDYYPGGDLRVLRQKQPDRYYHEQAARTHEYLAPEIIKGDGHGSAVDWWTFGIFLYELFYKRTPFKGLGNDETLANVVLQSLEFLDTPLVSFQAWDLIKGLLVKEPENQLGSQKGAAEIKQHPFFSGLN